MALKLAPKNKNCTRRERQRWRQRWHAARSASHFYRRYNDNDFFFIWSAYVSTKHSNDSNSNSQHSATWRARCYKDGITRTRVCCISFDLSHAEVISMFLQIVVFHSPPTLPSLERVKSNDAFRAVKKCSRWNYALHTCSSCTSCSSCSSRSSCSWNESNATAFRVLFTFIV